MEGHYDLIEVFARSQQDFPIGVGVKRSLFCKRKVIGDKQLEFCTRQQLNRLISELRKEYAFMKAKEQAKNDNIV